MNKELLLRAAVLASICSACDGLDPVMARDRTAPSSPGAPGNGELPAPMAPRPAGTREAGAPDVPGRPPARWVWPSHFFEAEHDARFGARQVLAEVRARDAQGQYKLRSLDALLATELFVKQGPVEFGRSMYMERTRGMFKNAPEGPVTPNTPRVMSALGTTVLSAQNDPTHADSYDKLEMVYTDRDTAETTFYLIDMASKNADERIQENPKRCESCHDQHFVWGMYPYWPGAKKSLPSSLGLKRRWRNVSPNGFQVALFELNLARIARSLLQNEAYYAVEKPMIAALLDCPLELFPFRDEPTFVKRRTEVQTVYYREVRELIDETVAVNGEKLPYTVDEYGVVSNAVVLNERDPLRLALVQTLLERAGAGVQTRSWSMSRRPGETSTLFQSAGGIGLSQLAFYLVMNSRNYVALRAMVPDIEPVANAQRVAPPRALCRELTREL